MTNLEVTLWVLALSLPAGIITVLGLWAARRWARLRNHPDAFLLTFLTITLALASPAPMAYLLVRVFGWGPGL